MAQQERDSVDLLPMLNVYRPGDPPGMLQSPIGGYVRFWIERNQAPAPVTDNIALDPRYGLERRNWLARFLIGQNHTEILTAKLVVNRASVVTQTVTLASAAHDSNRRQGENWSSELGERRFLTPYFRVDQGTTASIEVALSASARIDADITRNLLTIIERGARLVAPKGPLVTSLTSSRITETSDFIDTSVSRLFGEAVAERSLNDFPADGWYRGSVPLAIIAADFPMGRHVWSGPDTRAVGTWRVLVSEPIVSIFSPVTLSGDSGNPAAGTPEAGCITTGGAKPEPLIGQDRRACLAFLGLTPSRVLGLSVGENTTLGQALRGDSGISGALQRYAVADDKGPAAVRAAREICVLVAERGEGLGLNAYDTAAALWAFATNGTVASEILSRMRGSDCAVSQLAERVHLDLNMNSAAPAVTTPATPNGNDGH